MSWLIMYKINVFLHLMREKKKDRYDKWYDVIKRNIDK